MGQQLSKLCCFNCTTDASIYYTMENKPIYTPHILHVQGQQCLIEYLMRFCRPTSFICLDVQSQYKETNETNESQMLCSYHYPRLELCEKQILVLQNLVTCFNIEFNTNYNCTYSIECGK